jgi:Ca2+-dependent lipid-binding protein
MKSLIQVGIKEARDLKKSDKFGLSDPYCNIILGTQKAKTGVKMITLNPVWNEWFILEVSDPNTEVLVIRVMDWDKIGSADKIGHLTISLLRVFQNKTIDGWYELAQTTSGDIHICINVIKDDLDTSKLTIQL